MRGGRPAAWLQGVLVLSAIVITVPTGRRPFWSSDEARYALLGQDVLERGQWLVAQLRDPSGTCCGAGGPASSPGSSW